MDVTTPRGLPSSANASTTRDQSYLQNGSKFLDRLRTRVVCKWVLDRIPRVQNLRVLDLGCGYHATFLRTLGSRLSEGVGIDSDISEDCQRDPRLRFALGSIESELPKQPDNTYDVVLLISVLEHLFEPDVCLSHCNRVLKPAGLLLVHVPTWYAKPLLEFSAFKLNTSPACEMDDHKMYYSKRDLWPMLVRAGFKPSQIRLSYTAAGMTLLAGARK